ncbi:MAG: lysylphosphatidylglycerol synthase transmembrane domain-containing protein [Thermoguttaceae bacterium]
MLKRLFPWIKFLVVLIIILWVGLKLKDSWDILSQQSWNVQPAWFILAGLFFVLGFFPACLYWRFVLWKMGQRPSLYGAIRAYYLSQLGKYTPGKALAVIMRAEIIRSKETRASFAAACVFFETFCMMSVGALLAAIITLFWFAEHPLQFYFAILNVVMLVVASLPIYPPIFRIVAKKVGVGKGDPELDEKFRKIELKTILIGWGMMFFSWFFFGLSLWATLHSLGITLGPITQVLPELIAIMSMSVVFGFILMTPGGLGPREWILIETLAPLIALSLQSSEPHLSSQELLAKATALALVIAGLQRAVSIFAEVAVALLLVGFPEKKSANEKTTEKEG